jgi:hypothetical protein
MRDFIRLDLTVLAMVTAFSGGHSRTSGDGNIDTSAFPDIGNGMIGVNVMYGHGDSATYRVIGIHVIPVLIFGMVVVISDKVSPRFAGLFNSLNIYFLLN